MQREKAPYVNIRIVLRTSAVIGLGLVLAATTGCCGPTALERDYGNSWAYNKVVQIANPEAASVETPATGLSPDVGTTVMGTYTKTFSGKKAAGSGGTTINLGGLTSSGGGGGGGN